MPDVAFKDLCIDVTAGDDRAATVARFWGLALGQEVVTRPNGSRHLAASPGTPKSRTVWINEVPESPAGKSRVHLDLRVVEGDPRPLLDAGATVEREPGVDPWWVLNDPDRVPLCVFGPHPMDPSALGPFELVVDSADPDHIAGWWAERTGGTVGRRDDAAFVWIHGAADFPFMFWVFARVPEPKTVKNRVHWDVTLVDADVDGLVAAGATLLRSPDDEIDWWVLADPEGNEFCAFAPRQP